jgi:AcrR family transcriptional regulator
MYEEPGLTVVEIARQVGVSKRMIYNYARNGRWQARRLTPERRARAQARRFEQLAGALREAMKVGLAASANPDRAAAARATQLAKRLAAVILREMEEATRRR